jgi:uncharacterized membrane protein
MMETIMQVLLTLAAVGSGLVGGIFFAFSSFVMRALARLPAAHGTAAMQAINITVINPLFLLGFMGTAVACGILLIGSLAGLPGAGPWVIAGCLSYLVGTLVVTLVCNVPLNQELARVDDRTDGAASLWEVYVREWTAWNHVRTASALTAAGSLTIGLTGIM